MPQKIIMKKKLQIYTPKNSFEIDTRLLTVLILWSVAFLFYFAKSIFPTYEENLDSLGMLFVIIAILYSLYSMISNIFTCEPTNGEYSGYLIIDSDKITCNL